MSKTTHWKNRSLLFLKILATIFGVLSLFTFGLLFFSSYSLVNSVSRSASDYKKKELAQTSYSVETNSVKPVLKKKNDENPDMQVTSISELHQHLATLEVAEEIEKDLNLTEVNSICEIICSPSYIDTAELKKNKMEYLVSFYRMQGSFAFEDPVFRSTLENLVALSKLYPRSLRNLIFEVNKAGSMSEIEKIALSAKLPSVLISELESIHQVYPEIKKRMSRVSAYSKLMRLCKQEGELTVVQRCHEAVALQ